MEDEMNFRDYQKQYLPHFENLQDFFASKVRQNPPLEEIQCWEALNNLAYGTVENLWLIKLHIEKDGSISNILPSFMAIFTMCFPIAEYLQMMMRILGTNKINTTLSKILSKNDDNVKEDQVEAFWNIVEDDKLKMRWKSYFWKYKRIRNTFTHSFRIPWWYRNEDHKKYGFPKSIIGKKADINKVIVDFASDPKAWEKRIFESKNHEFISGFKLITDRYDESLKIANRLFPIIIAHF